MAKEKETTFEDLVDNGILQIARAFGKGEDLRGAVWAICAGTANWATQETEKRLKEKG